MMFPVKEKKNRFEKLLFFSSAEVLVSVEWDHDEDALFHWFLS